jgi:hypothetical protein
VAERIGKPSRIAPLSDFDDRDVAAGDLDVRGWDVIAADGERLGVVDELLIDTGTGRVRYLDVDLEDDLVEALSGRAQSAQSPLERPQPAGDSLLGDVNPAFAAGTSKAQAPSQKIERRTDTGALAPADSEGGTRHVLLPIGRLRIAAEAEQVFLAGMGSREAAALPAYRPGASLPALERALAERFGQTPEIGNVPSVPANAATAANAAEDRFWRSGAGAADTGTVPPEPGTTPAELEPDELEPGLEAEKRGSR